MGDYKHLVVVEFKEDADVDDILKEMEKFLSENDLVKSYEWGKDLGGQDIPRQGFTHAFSMTFRDKEDLGAFLSHPEHVRLSDAFSPSIEKKVVLDFACVPVKAAPV